MPNAVSNQSLRIPFSSSAAITLHSDGFAFKAEVAPPGSRGPTKATAHAYMMRVGAPASLVAQADPLSPLEQALKAAGLEEVVGVVVSDVQADYGVGAKTTMSLSVDQQAGPVIVLKIPNDQAEVVVPDRVQSVPGQVTFSLRMATQHPRNVLPTQELSFASDIPAAFHSLVKVYRYVGTAILGPVVDWAVGEVGKYIERSNKPREELQTFTPAAAGALVACIAPMLASMAGQRNLLLVHGIFSSTEGGFGGLRNNTDFLNHVANPTLYNNRVVGWNHWTVSESPHDNAAALAAALPAGATYDIVCHSRGGLVVRNLLEDGAIQASLGAKNIKVGKVMFVAGAYAGDPLVDKDNPILRIAGVMAALCQRVPNPVVEDLAVALKVLTALAHGVQNMPGVHPLAPSDVSAQTWSPTLAADYYYAWANYALDGAVWDGVIDETVETALGGVSDFVIPYGSASLQGAASVTDFRIIGSLTTPQQEVNHIRYFSSDKDLTVPKFLMNILV